MEYVSGEILTENGFKSGYLGFEKNKITEIGGGLPSKKPICKGVIIPTFVNAHTHIGDSFVKRRNIKLPRDVEKLVAPPDGLKYKLLKEAPEEEIIDGMRESIDLMIKTGVSIFCDFRENGVKGIWRLKKALGNTNISSLILSRPEKLKYDRNELEMLLKNSQGIGVSSISDWDYSELEKVAGYTEKKGKMFAIHASERVREDIDLILDLKPDFLVHMVKASVSDLIRVKDADIPVVVCPRSNAFFGLKSNIKMMKKIGIRMILGTDNAMLNPPSVLDEVRYLHSISKEFSMCELLQMATYTPRKALNLDGCILELSSPAEFVVLDKSYLGTLYVSAVR